MEETTQIRNRKFRLKDRLKVIAQKIGNVFKDYPVTLGCIVVIAAIAAVIIDCGFDTDFCEKTIMFLAAFAVQALFAEEYFKDRLSLRIAGYAIAVPISALFVYLGWLEGDTFLGMKKDKADELTVCIYGTYFACLILATLYHMYRRQQENFEAFCLKTFVGLLRTTIVYGLFAGGLALIILIFNELIYDTDALMGRVEIFLAGGIYVPALLLVLSGKKDDVGKFAKICVMYVLEPMLVMAMAIIYIYIIKIFVTGDIPSNTVFGIITALFVAGMVIWTQAQGIGEDNIFCRAANILPFIFVPCIILQAWSIFIRIGEYGVTPDRYFGVVLVIFELIYMLLYLLKRITGRDCVSAIIWVAAATVAIVLLVPYANYASVSVRSQVKRLSGFTVNEQLKSSEQAGMAGSAYRTLTGKCGFRGEEAAEELYTEAEREILASCYDNSSYAARPEYYLSDGINPVDLDISAYKKLSFAEGYEKDPENTLFTLKVKDSVEYEADLSGFITDLKNFGRERAKSSNYESFGLENYGLISLDETHDLKIIRFSSNYDSEKDELDYLNVDCYILEK